MNKWKIATIVLASICIILLTIQTINQIKYNNEHKDKIRVGDLVVSKKNLEDILNAIPFNQTFQLCDIEENKCIIGSK